MGRCKPFLFWSRPRYLRRNSMQDDRQQILERLSRIERMLAELTGQRAETVAPVDADAIKLLARRTAQYGEGALHDFNARR